MKNAAFFSFFLLFYLTSTHAQQGYDIRIKMDGYHYDTLWFGATYGKRAVPQDFAVKQADGYFNLKNETPMPSGMYAIIFKRSASSAFQYMSCWLADDQRTFALETDFNKLSKSTTVAGSRENELLYQYFSRYYELTDRLDDLSDAWKDAMDEASFLAFVDGEENLSRFQEDFVQKNPGTLTAELIRQTQYLTPPGDHEKFADWQAEATGRHHWQRTHFFDKMDIGGGDFLKYPLWVDRTDFYFSKLPPPVPDSMIVMIEDVLQRLSPDQDAYRYYFRYIMNSLSRMSRYRTDEVFVYFVRQYLDTGKADWLEEDDQRKYRSDAGHMEPLFVGKTAPDVTFSDPTGKEVSIYSVEAPYTLLVFWLYDCSHCKRELPIVMRLFEKYQSKGLKVMSVCGKTGEDQAPPCWEFAKQMNMPAEWYILADPLRRSRFSTALNVRSYPRMILLDANKKILYKQNGEVPEQALELELGRAMQ